MVETKEKMNEQARAYALQHTVKREDLLTATVSYESEGKLLLLGPADRLSLVRRLLPSTVKVTQLESTDLVNGASNQSPSFTIKGALRSRYLQDVTLSGYLGAFQVTGRDKYHRPVTLADDLAGYRSMDGSFRFDLILDLGLHPLHSSARPPIGYMHIGPTDELTIAKKVAALSHLIGTFDKPRYFQLNSELCALTARGIAGCSRCLDLCPTDALNVIDGRIQINPYVCQGVGSCASVCPTGAISYQQPDANISSDYLFALLEHYRHANGVHPVLLIGGEEERAQLEREGIKLPTHWLPLWLEESATLGLDSWLAAFAYGASAVYIALGEQTPALVRDQVIKEIGYGGQFLMAAGLSPSALATYSFTALQEAPLMTRESLVDQPLQGSKRARLFAAFDALWQVNQGVLQPLPMPADAPYGTVTLQEERCTLCMGCVAVCPTNALQTSGNQPQLNFIEQQCIQCGICQQACPEQAIRLQAQLQPNWQLRTKVNPLKVEEAAHCLCCNKPFAPLSLLTRIQQKLQHHAYYQGDAASRLLMCEACRVKDLFTSLAADPLGQLKL